MRGVWLISLIGLMSSCGFRYHDTISGNGKIEDLEIDVKGLSGLSVSDNLDVVLIPSDTFRLVLHADKNLHDVIDYQVKNNSIDFSCNKRIRMARSKEIRVYGGFITSINARLQATVQSYDSIEHKNFSLILNSGASGHLIGSFDTLQIESGAGTNLFFEGQTTVLNLIAFGGADVFASSLNAIDAMITASSAADVHIGNLDIARFNVSSFSEIYYQGDPLIMESTTSGFSKIKKE